jgi:predicted  nucleic acid-binding Zn-ribbon protein
MDKKTKKRLEILRQKVEKNQKLLAAAKQQTDEPDEIQKIEQQIVDLKSEITELKSK